MRGSNLCNFASGFFGRCLAARHKLAFHNRKTAWQHTVLECLRWVGGGGGVGRCVCTRGGVVGVGQSVCISAAGCCGLSLLMHCKLAVHSNQHYGNTPSLPLCMFCGLFMCGLGGGQGGAGRFVGGMSAHVGQQVVHIFCWLLWAILAVCTPSL